MVRFLFGVVFLICFKFSQCFFEYKSFKQSVNDVHYLSGATLLKSAPDFVLNQFELSARFLASSQNSQDQIPKIMHFIWIGGVFPSYLNFCLDSWKKLHPDWNIILWDDKKVQELDMQNINLYNAVNNVGSRVDILRLEILKQFGGVYVDTDFFCLKSINSLIKMDYFQSTESIGNTIINNGIIGCVPNYYIIKDMLEELSKKHLEGSDIDNVLELAGPYFMMNFFINKYTHNKSYLNERVIFLPPSFFCSFPFTYLRTLFWDSDLFLCDLIKRYTMLESYAVHLWNNGWISKRRNKALDLLKEKSLVFTKSNDIKQILNAQNSRGYTPLIIATINGWKKLVEELLRNGASIDIEDNQGLRVLDYAKKNEIYSLFEPYIKI